MPQLEFDASEFQPGDVTPATTWRERLGSATAWCGLAVVDGLLKIAGFERFHRFMRSWPVRGKAPGDSTLPKRTCAAVDRAATYYFKRAWCLQRSAATVCLLRLRGVPAELVIGARKMPFAAHAWVEVDGRVLNNHSIVQEQYTVLERC